MGDLVGVDDEVGNSETALGEKIPYANRCESRKWWWKWLGREQYAFPWNGNCSNRHYHEIHTAIVEGNDNRDILHEWEKQIKINH